MGWGRGAIGFTVTFAIGWGKEVFGFMVALAMGWGRGVFGFTGKIAIGWGTGVFGFTVCFAMGWGTGGFGFTVSFAIGWGRRGLVRRKPKIIPPVMPRPLRRSCPFARGPTRLYSSPRLSPDGPTLSEFPKMRRPRLLSFMLHPPIRIALPRPRGSFPS